MENNIQNRLIDAVHSDFDWKKNEIRIDEVERLKRGSCSFYTAGHLVRPIGYLPNYAVIAGEQILNAGDKKNVAKIIDTCGADAPAGWCAEVVTRFHPDLGAGVVLQDEKENDAAVRKIVEAKKEFFQPKFSGDAKTKGVTFFLLEPESFTVYLVQAVRDADNNFAITRTQIS